MRLLLIFLFVSGMVLGQGAKLAIDSSQMLIGSQNTLRVELSLGEQIQWKNYKQEEGLLQEGIEIISISDIDTSFESSLPVYSQELIITSFDTGYYVIEPFKFPLMNSEDTVVSNPVLLRVNYPSLQISEGEKVELADIKDQMDRPFHWKELLQYWWILAVVILVFVAFFLWKQWQSKPRDEKVKPKVIIPADVIAMQKLESLENREAWLKMEVKTFISELSYILREYIENRYAILALEKTTVEIRTEIIAVASKDEVQELESLLESLDMAKYAKTAYSSEENKDFLQGIKKWVNQTKEVKLED